MNFKKILLILRKLGIIRAGSYSWKGDAKDRPIEAIMDNVYDSKKDLITKKDIKKVKEKISTKSCSKNGICNKCDKIVKNILGTQKKLPNKIIRKIIHALSVTIVVFTFLIFVVNEYLGFWFWVDLILWFTFLHYTKNFVKGTLYSLPRMIAILSILILFTFFSLGLSGPANNSNIKYTTITNPIEMVELAMELEEEMQLEEVQISESSNAILEIRTKTPPNISPEAISAASSYIFKYVNDEISGNIKTFRLILTVNHIDGLIIETSNLNLQKWIKGELTDLEFIEAMKKINLI